MVFTYILKAKKVATSIKPPQVMSLLGERRKEYNSWLNCSAYMDVTKWWWEWWKIYFTFLNGFSKKIWKMRGEISVGLSRKVKWNLFELIENFTYIKFDP